MRLSTMPLLLALLFLFPSCSKEISAEGLHVESEAEKEVENEETNTAYLELQFKHTVDGQPLQMETTYKNSLEENFSISKLKYYISNIALYEGPEGDPMPDTYFLVDAAVDSTTTIRMPIEPGMYQNLDLMLGVDSTRNVSGAQTGALDPLHDMFWTWNTGYIMMKVEGTSTASTAPDNRIQYHIGGFAGPYSALRTIGMSMFNPVEVRSGQTLSVKLSADLNRWFDGVHELPIHTHAVAMTPDSLSSLYADNAAAMIQVNSVSVK